ncbi:MAG: efflux RND transporter periplasmic adaptor subunit [Campylobacterota bacterium]
MIKTILLFVFFISTMSAEPATSRAVIISYDETILSSQLAGSIKYLKKIEGDYFKKDELLIKLDCEIYEAKKKKAAIEKNIAYLKYKKNKKLESFKSIGKFEVDISKEEFRRQSAQHDIASLNVKRCSIHAPYNGRVIERKVSQYQNVKPNEEILKIVRTDNLEAKTFVPSTWLTWLKKGDSVDLNVDETQTSLKAVIKELGPVVDPVSQTILVRVALKKPYKRIIPGMSATVVFKKESKEN